MWCCVFFRGHILFGATLLSFALVQDMSLRMGTTSGEATALTQRVLVTRSDNFTPPSRTPWGGTRIVELFKPQLAATHTGIVGESWELSGHPSFPSRVADDFLVTDLCAACPIEFLGAKNVAQSGPQLPFLVKLLNSRGWQSAVVEVRNLLVQLGRVSGPLTPALSQWEREVRDYHEIHRSLVALTAQEWPSAAQSIIEKIRALHTEMLAANLSIQVHPPRGYDVRCPPKAESWVILEAESGAGIYLGLRDGVTREQFAALLTDGADFVHGDVSELLNFVPVKSGDIFFVTPGTLHAIGAGIVLLEVAENSDTTFRAFDWFRKPARMVHVAETLAVTQWSAPRGAAAVAELRCAACTTRRQPHDTPRDWLVNAPEFGVWRAQLLPGTCDRGDTTISEITGVVVLQGALQIHTPHNAPVLISAGQSCLLPAALGRYTLEAMSAVECFGVVGAS